MEIVKELKKEFNFPGIHSTKDIILMKRLFSFPIIPVPLS